MLDNPVLSGSFTIGDNSFTLEVAKIDDLDEGRWYEIEINEGSGPMRTRAAVDFINPATDPVGFTIAMLEALRRQQVALKV